MPNDKLPNPLPAGSVVWIPDNTPSGIRYDLTSPVHILDEGMVEAVRDEVEMNEGMSYLSHGARRCADKLKNAFAHCLVPSEPEQPKVRVSCRAEVDAIVDRNDSPIGWTDESVRVLRLLADALDAQQKSIDDIRKRLP